MQSEFPVGKLKFGHDAMWGINPTFLAMTCLLTFRHRSGGDKVMRSKLMMGAAFASAFLMVGVAPAADQ
jgi:hypothetical protein